MPKSIQDYIDEEYLRLLKSRQGIPPEVIAPSIFPPAELETALPEAPQWAAPQFETPQQAPEWATPQFPQQTTPQPAPTLPVSPTLPIEKPKEKPIEVPFWQRSLQVFAAPFEWIDENIIKPGLSLLGTTAGFVPEVTRLPGEDYWEWKKRSWAGWKTPGININVPWSDEPARLDIRGILELAPWLLIPGAGQVGGGVRAARGVAGVLGKLGTVGRVAGAAVEYSPWGLVEKTAGVAIKGGVRAVGKVSERVSTVVGEKLFGKYVPPPVPTSVARLTKYAKEVVIPARKQFEKEKPFKVTARQEAKLQEVHAAYRRGEISLEDLTRQESLAMEGALAPEFAFTPEALAARQARNIADVEARVVSGELTEAGGKALITKIRQSPAFTAVTFPDAEIKELNDMIVNATESGLIKQESGRAFRAMIFDGQMPQPHHLEAWAKVFGTDFAKAVGQLWGKPDAARSLFESLNAFRTLQTSLDISGTFRQGLFFALLHPTRFPIWFGRQIKYLLSEKLSLDMDDALRARPETKEFLSRKGYLRPLREVSLGTAEESYMPGSFIRRIPGIRRSERAFAGLLNEEVVDVFAMGRNAMKAQGATEAEIDLFVNFINLLGGRGTLPKVLEKYAPVLNLVFFSPRLQAATLQLPRQIGRMFLSGNPYMRKEAAKALVTFVGGGSALLGLLKATGSKVEIDPRSGDFGKIKIGETRLDIWRGYIQYARFAAQLLSGERKSAYGNMSKAERGEIAGRFIQSKMSPVAGIMVDLWRGETYEGRPIFSDTTGFSKAARDRVLPLAVQDIIDAMEMSGVNGMWVAAPATLGIGALTYTNDFVKVKQKIAREMGYESWDEIDPKTQREIQNRNAELQTATIAFDRQVMGTAWGDWRLAGNAIEDVFRQNVELASAQYRATSDGYNFREKISDAFTARRGGYDAREKEPRFEDITKRLKTKDTVESLVGLGPEQLAIKVYNDALWGDDMYDEFGDYRFDEAEVRKQQLRQQLGDEMFDYVEEYRGVKYETFPPEYQELVRAKITLRPYWEITDQLNNMGWGAKFSETKMGQRLLTRLRRNMRLGNPEIAQAVALYYTR